VIPDFFLPDCFFVPLPSKNQMVAGKKSRAQVRLKKIQDADFGENNSQDKWLLPCPLPIINFSLNWCTSFSRKRFHFFHN
jgi:hypothetical protein